ncbi:Uncharacterised protein [Klebsiella pneumoniae]|nr:Uncharacterised protein [Klebsiella pneumoniae]
MQLFCNRGFVSVEFSLQGFTRTRFRSIGGDTSIFLLIDQTGANVVQISAFRGTADLCSQCATRLRFGGISIRTSLLLFL